MSAIPVFLKSQRPAVDRPSHSASKSLALLTLAASAARWVDEKKTAIQLLTCETWRQVKDRVRLVPFVKRRVEHAIDNGEHRCTMLSYPPAPHSYRERKEQREIWLKAERF